MNLLKDPWIPTDVGLLSPARALTEAREITWTRPDWNAMTYTFLCGLLQSAILRAPDLCPDVDAWGVLQDRPPHGLDSWLQPLRESFELYGDKGFMQVNVKSDKPIADAAILPEVPGENADKKNSGIFLHHQDRPGKFTDGERAIAIFTLGACGWSAGGGFLKNSRGGNAMTTLLVPEAPGTLWDTVWLNIFSMEQWSDTFGSAVWSDEKVFPWIDPHIREVKGGKRAVSPKSLHPLNVYWQMPMRNQWRDGQLFHEKGGQNGGLSYAEGGWRHPFTAYFLDKGNYRPVSCRTDMGFQYWSPYLLGDGAALNALNIFEHNSRGRDEARLWMFGWSINQAEALTWIDIKTPIVLSGRRGFAEDVNHLLSLANNEGKKLYAACKKAGLSKIPSLYSAVESDWYKMLQMAAEENVTETWMALLKKSSRRLYNEASAACAPMDYAAGRNVLR